MLQDRVAETYRTVVLTRESNPVRFAYLPKQVFSIEISCVFENGEPIHWVCRAYDNNGDYLKNVRMKSGAVEDIFQNERFENGKV